MLKKPAEGQLELFELGDASAPEARRYATGRVHFSLRHEQIVLIAIGGLIGLTVVFAWGVERGKLLVRAERPRLGANAAPVEPEPAPLAVQQSVAVPLAAPAPRVEPQAATQALVPSAVAIPPSVPAALAGAPTGKQYAIQVVTYKNRQYAERELKRLQETGERGFIVTSQTHAVLFVGPFDSKTAAKEKMTSLRSRYSDCFLKTL